MRALSTRTLAGALACLCLLTLTAAPAATQKRRKAAPKKYKIFCVGRVIEVEHKTLQEMREDEEDEVVCELTEEEFESLYKAREAAKRFGGAGEPCECAVKKAALAPLPPRDVVGGEVSFTPRRPWSTLATGPPRPCAHGRGAEPDTSGAGRRASRRRPERTTLC